MSNITVQGKKSSDRTKPEEVYSTDNALHNKLYTANSAGTTEAVTTASLGGFVDFRDEPAGNVRTMTGTSAQTAAITATYVRVVADADCAIAVGTSPTAVFNTSFHLMTDDAVVIKITTGDKIAAISGGSGNLYYHPVA